jgi:Methane oxygenase PmoA
MKSPLLLLLSFAAVSLHAAEWRLTVEAGDFDRQDSIVTFDAPEGVRGNCTLQAPGGSAIPLQIDSTGRAVFIEPQLAKGGQKIYTLSAAAELPTAISAMKDGDVLKFASQPGDVPIFNYQTAPGGVPEGVPDYFRHGAHLHPIHSPSGRIVTGNHPPDHRWHRGVWLAWTDTDFEGRHPDFWNEGKEKGGALTGEVRFASLERLWGGPVQGGFISHHRFIDHTGGEEKDALAETWEVAATRLPGVYVIDLTSTQTTAGDAPLKLPKYFYGGLGVRGPAEWDPVNQVSMLTSNGDDRKTGDNSKANWVHMGGDVDGQPAGITVLIHPGNFRFPQPLRLNPKNPQFCIAPSQGGDWEISPGKPYVSRYRLLIADGAPDKTDIDRRWNDYANPPKATLKSE